MKYSIIVPVHNAESTITRCIESIVNQNVGLQVILIGKRTIASTP